MNTPEDLLKKLKDIEYGWIAKDGKKHLKIIKRSEFEKEYYLQTPEDVEKNKIGVCWDQVEYERKFFEKNKYEYRTIFIMYDTGLKQHMHTFLVYKDKKNYCWIENTYPNYMGINRYPNMNLLIKDVLKDFLLKNHLLIIGQNIKFYMYDKPTYNINCEEYIRFCLKGTLLNKDFSNIGI